MTWYTRDKYYQSVDLSNLKNIKLDHTNLPDKVVYTSEDVYRIHKKSTEYPLTRKEYSIILKESASLIFDLLTEGYQINLPFNMGKLKIKSKKLSFIKNDKGHILGPVNWKKTNELWEKSKKDKENKTLIYYTNEHSEYMTYRVSWLKSGIKVKNSIFYHFSFTKTMKTKLSKLLKKGWTI